MKIHDKAQTKYHDGNILEDTKNDLKQIVANTGAYGIANCYRQLKRTKQLDFRHRFIQEKFNQKSLKIFQILIQEKANQRSLKLFQVPKTKQEADFLTKSVSRMFCLKKRWPISDFQHPNDERRNINLGVCYIQFSRVAIIIRHFVLYSAFSRLSSVNRNGIIRLG